MRFCFFISLFLNALFLTANFNVPDKSVIQYFSIQFILGGVDCSIVNVIVKFTFIFFEDTSAPNNITNFSLSRNILRKKNKEMAGQLK